MTGIIPGTRRRDRTRATSVCPTPQSQVSRVIREGKLNPLEFARDILQFLKTDRPRGPTQTKDHLTNLCRFRQCVTVLLAAAKTQRTIHEQAVQDHSKTRARLLEHRQKALAQSVRLVRLVPARDLPTTDPFTELIRIENETIVSAQTAIARIDATIDVLREAQRKLNQALGGEGNGDNGGTGSVV